MEAVTQNAAEHRPTILIKRRVAMRLSTMDPICLVAAVRGTALFIRFAVADWSNIRALADQQG